MPRWWKVCIVLTTVGCGAVLQGNAAKADRSAAQGPSGLYLEKSGRYAEAALYYQRSLRGFEEVWVKFWYFGRPDSAHEATQQLLAEYQARLDTCLRKAELGAAQRRQMELVNEIWMEEYVDQELGGYKLAFAYRAEEAEKHGDFLLAEQLRFAAAEYCRLVAIPFHERIASDLEKRQLRARAILHRKAATRYEHEAEKHEMLGRGDQVLARMAELQSPASEPGLGEHYFKSYRVYHQRVLSDTSSPEGYAASVEGNRADLARIIGVIDPRVPVVLQRFGTDDNPALAAESTTVRWCTR